MVELELEKTYLARQLPAGLLECRSEVIRDLYMPESADHPILRLRQRGDRYEITKKIPVEGADSSRQNEHTISLTPEEFQALSHSPGRLAAKRRYYCTIEGHEAEVDIYEENLAGLVIIDFEFADEQSLESFIAPSICLADVTQEAFAAGGVLAGKTYEEIEPVLQRYGYEKLSMEAQS